MDTRIAQLEVEIVRLRADVARADREPHTLRNEVQSTKAELSCVSLRIRGRGHADDFRAVVIPLIVITFALFAALWRGLGWI